MQPTDVLMSEHRLIEQVLNCLEKIVQQAEAAKKLDKTSALEAIDFCRFFADGCHHTKEEAHLFPVMEANGFSGGCSPVAVMQREHELGRLYMQAMAAAVESAAAGEPEALTWFVEHGKSYIKLLREHIHKEDACLFPAGGAARREVTRRSGDLRCGRACTARRSRRTAGSISGRHSLSIRPPDGPCPSRPTCRDQLPATATPVRRMASVGAVDGALARDRAVGTTVERAT